MNAQGALLLLAGLTAAVYSVAGRRMARLPAMGGIRIVAIGAFAVMSALRQGAPIMTCALALSALSGLTVGGVRIGLAAQIWADLGYGALFVRAGGGAGALIAEPARGLGEALVLAIVAMLIVRLVSHRAQWPAFAVIAVQTLLLGAALTLPHFLWPAALGALCLLLSSFSGLAGSGPGVWRGLCVQATWWLYWAGQALIASAFWQ